MYSTIYHRATSISDAVALATGEARYVSGGMTLIPAMKTRLAAPSDLIDLRHIDALKGIAVSGDTITIGAATTHNEVAESAEVSQACPALADLAHHIGDPLVRHMGTIGGSVANNDPAADYPAALLALGATVVTNTREIKAADFFTGLFETALGEGEMVTAVRFPIPKRAGYEKFRNPASRYAMTGVFVADTADGVRVAVAGAGDSGVFRSAEIEAALASDFSAQALQGITVPSGSLMSDMHASAAYRANLVVVMAKRAVMKAGGGA